MLQAGLNRSWEFGAQGRASRGELRESRERVADHRGHVEVGGRLIQAQEGLGAIGIEFEECMKEPLGDIRGSEVDAVQDAEQGERVEPSPFQAFSEVRWA
jgi:hypothetical protein